MRFIISLFFLIFVLPSTSMANVNSSAIYSPNCDEKQLREIAGDALIKISKQKNWSENNRGYIISLDTNKMNYGQLAKEMNGKGCFKTD